MSTPRSGHCADKARTRSRQRATMIRRETIRLIDIAGSGHYTSVYSAAEMLATLYSGVMRLARIRTGPSEIG